MTTFPAQTDHELRRQFKTATSHLRYRFLPATSTAVATPCREKDQIRQTVCNRYVDYGIRVRHPYHGLRLTPPRRRYRAHWAHQHLNWTQNQWNTVLVSDESQFCWDRPNGCMKFCHRRGEHYSDALHWTLYFHSISMS